MRLPDGTTLMHAGKPYDPAKAHEYYLRTRKLKGRRLGAGPVGLKDAPKAKQPARNNPKLAKQRADAATRVAVLKEKLSKLNAALKKRMAEAEQADRKAKKPDTAADKADKARDSKKYRDKHKQEIKTKARQANDKKSPDTKKSGEANSVQELKSTIEKVQRNLKAAIAKQRALG